MAAQRARRLSSGGGGGEEEECSPIMVGTDTRYRQGISTVRASEVYGLTREENNCSERICARCLNRSHVTPTTHAPPVSAVVTRSCLSQRSFPAFLSLSRIECFILTIDNSVQFRLIVSVHELCFFL